MCDEDGTSKAGDLEEDKKGDLCSERGHEVIWFERRGSRG